METSVRESKFVLLVCTPNFAQKADAGRGGVGYEKTIITGEIFTGEVEETKFVPLLRDGDAKESLPSYLKSRLFIDFRDDSLFETKLEELLRHFHDEPLYTPPPIGPKPDWTKQNDPPPVKKDTVSKPAKKSTATAPAQNPPQQPPIENTIGMKFVLIPAGNFMMGGKLNVRETFQNFGGDAKYYIREHPQHNATISEPFYLQSTPVTQWQWGMVMGDNPSTFKSCGDDCPVESVIWENSQKFIKKLNEMEGGEAYRLPTEAEWEYACRAGTTTEFSFGDHMGELTEYAWHDNNSDGKTHPVGQKEPNDWRLYDMYGNVWEWVEDDWHDNYNGAPNDGRAWIDEPRGADRVIRGGSWHSGAQYCRSAYRNDCRSDGRDRDVGFRLARSVALTLDPLDPWHLPKPEAQ